jgi:two-component system, chemotaxis family, chemotaxis protein CheY
MVECLLIDRDAGERHRVGALLGSLGLALTERAAPADGLSYCNDNQPDVVLMAAGSLEITSADFMRRMRKSPAGRKPVVILYAAEPDTDEIGQSILEGAADFILKPFDRDLLRFKLKQAGVI